MEYFFKLLEITYKGVAVQNAVKQMLFLRKSSLKKLQKFTKKNMIIVYQIILMQKQK